MTYYLRRNDFVAEGKLYYLKGTGMAAAGKSYYLTGFVYYTEDV